MTKNKKNKTKKVRAKKTNKVKANNKITSNKKDLKKDKKSNKKKYKVRNWKEYNESLVNRGRIELLFDEVIILSGWNAEPNGKRGAQPVYTDLAIEITLQFGKVFGQKLRQTEGLVKSIFKVAGLGNLLDVPDYSTLSKRGGDIKVNLPKDTKEKIIFIVDSTGLKIYGEGEWKVRQHGVSKRRTWRKAHIAITPDGEIRAAELTDNSTADCEVIEKLLNQETAVIDSFAADGGYDKENVYQSCKERKIENKNVLIPPQKNAKIKRHGNLKSEPHARDENLRQIRKTSRKQWKETSGYHIRSLVETAMFRFKTIFGDKLNARKLKNQTTEFLLSASILNKMTKLGMPDSYAVA